MPAHQGPRREHQRRSVPCHITISSGYDTELNISSCGSPLTLMLLAPELLVLAVGGDGVKFSEPPETHSNVFGRDSFGATDLSEPAPSSALMLCPVEGAGSGSEFSKFTNSA